MTGFKPLTIFQIILSLIPGHKDICIANYLIRAVTVTKLKNDNMLESFGWPFPLNFNLNNTSIVDKPSAKCSHKSICSHIHNWSLQTFSQDY